MENVEVTVPGKLYIAGEYAVVTPGHWALLMTVDRFLTVKINKKSKGTGTLLSTNYSPTPHEWSRQGEDQQFQFLDWSHPYHLLSVVIQTVEGYVKDFDRAPLTYDVVIESQLDRDGQKLGLGSSGAVTIGMVKALLQLYDIQYDDYIAYKLAVIAHMNLKSVGSFGDLAACSFTGVIAYSCADRSWLNIQMENHSIRHIVEKRWPKLSVKSLDLPKDLEILVGWTGAPASTEDLVSKVYQDQGEIAFKDFLTQSQNCLESLISALNHGHIDQVLELIQVNRKLLQQMGQAKGKLIETPKLTQLIEIANQLGASGKTSGAGGGDCGIALLSKSDRHKATDQIRTAWEDAGIKMIDLSIYKNGDFNG